MYMMNSYELWLQEKLSGGKHVKKEKKLTNIGKGCKCFLLFPLHGGSEYEPQSPWRTVNGLPA